MPKRDLQVSLTNSANAWGENRLVTLHIEERLSGETLADIDMSADQFVGLLGSLSTTLEGFVTGNPERLGKAQKVASLDITRESLGIGDAGPMIVAEQEAATRAIAEAHAATLPEGTVLRYLTRTNTAGYRAVYDRWEEPTEDDLKRARGIRR